MYYWCAFEFLIQWLFDDLLQRVLKKANLSFRNVLHHTHTNTHTHTHTHTLKWQTEIERTLSKKLNTLWGWTFYWNVNIWEQNIFSYNFIFSCCLKWIYLRLICNKKKKWWRCLSIRQPLSKMWKHQNRFQNKNSVSWKKSVVTFGKHIYDHD